MTFALRAFTALLFVTLPARAQFVPYQVVDLHPGAADSEPEELTVMGGELYFAANDGSLGRELWKTDGSAPPTLVVDINTTGFSYIDECTALGALLIFEADDGSGRELFRSDGTAAGTYLLTGTIQGVQDLVRMGSHVLFRHSDFVYGAEVWRTDGSLAGTQIVADVRPGSPGSSPYPGAVVGNEFFFFANDGSIGHEPWKTDGTAAGTGLVKDVWPGVNPGGIDPGVGLGGVFYFAGQTALGREPWRSDGTSAGTWMLRDVRPGGTGSFPQDFTVSGGRVFFSADDGTNGRELWTSDGTQAGTTLVRDIRPGAQGSKPFQSLYGLVDVAGTLFFYADDGVNGGELWNSDGTLSGTVMVADLYPGVGASLVSGGIDAGGVLYFSAAGPVVGLELWRSDGTAAGTHPVSDIWPGGWSSSPAELQVFGSRVYFSATDGSTGRELWALEVCELQAPVSYCTAGTTASGCKASAGGAGVPSVSSPSGFVVTVSDVEGDKDGILFFGVNGRKASSWGNGSSYQCVVPPVKRLGLQTGVGTPGLCNGAFALDFNTWASANPTAAPSAGVSVDLQCWFRDPFNTSNQSTSLSDALEFLMCP
jgi:ELWxxDGT repeat protein